MAIVIKNLVAVLEGSQDFQLVQLLPFPGQEACKSFYCLIPLKIPESQKSDIVLSSRGVDDDN